MAANRRDGRFRKYAYMLCVKYDLIFSSLVQVQADNGHDTRFCWVRGN